MPSIRVNAVLPPLRVLAVLNEVLDKRRSRSRPAPQAASGKANASQILFARVQNCELRVRTLHGQEEVQLFGFQHHLKKESASKAALSSIIEPNPSTRLR